MDVRGILKSVIRLQNTYNVTASEMASGIILGIKVPVLSGMHFDLFRDTYLRNVKAKEPNNLLTIQSGVCS